MKSTDKPGFFEIQKILRPINNIERGREIEREKEWNIEKRDR